MFTQMQTSPANKVCLNILNEAGLFVLNIYKWSFKHCHWWNFSKVTPGNKEKEGYLGDSSSSAANEQRNGDNKHVFFFNSPGLSCLI